GRAHPSTAQRPQRGRVVDVRFRRPFGGHGWPPPSGRDAILACRRKRTATTRPRGRSPPTHASTRKHPAAHPPPPLPPTRPPPPPPRASPPAPPRHAPRRCPEP